jgi:hypothetical protein
MLIFFRLLWPYIFRFIMNQGSERMAEYLEVRRQKRLGILPEVSGSAEENEILPVVDEQVDAPVQVVCAPPPPPSFFNSDGFWFTLSGIALGIAISIVAAIIKQATQKQQ